MLEELFKNTIEEYGLLKRKDKVILGVSGGPDSICLLYQFNNIARDYKLKLVCAHFNHSLRKEADDEENFIRNVCDNLNIKFISDKKDVAKFHQGDSLEQTARVLRYDFFLKCAQQVKIKKLALAHHKDDLAETILMRFLRGAGLRGLRGFLPKTKFKGLTVIRPFIGITKKEIIQWLKSEKIPYCVDKSNFEEKFFRNRVRLKLIPFLKEFNPNIEDTLYNLGRNVSVDYDFIYTYSRNSFEELKRGETKKGIKLDAQGLQKMPLAVLNNVIRIALEEIKGDIKRLEFRHLEEVRDLIFNRPQGSIVDLPGVIVKKDEGVLFIQRI